MYIQLDFEIEEKSENRSVKIGVIWKNIKEKIIKTERVDFYLY